MLVKSQCAGNRVTGLYVGKNNVRRYFSKKIESIDIQLDHLLIQCGLSQHFWNGEPEIHDPRLCLWLEAKQSKGSNCRSSMPLYMIPSGEGMFVLGIAEPQAHARERESASETAIEILETRLALAASRQGAAA